MNQIFPASDTDWGNINAQIASSTDPDLLLNLSSFINVSDYYHIEITTNINNFYILGNSSLFFYSSIEALNRLNKLNVEVKNLNLRQDKNVPTLNIAKNLEYNTLIFESINNLENLSKSETTNNSCIFISYGTTLYISGSPSNNTNILSVIGGVYGAGIGSGNYIDAGNIYFLGNNTKISALGGDGASAIGGGIGGNGGEIIIGDSAIITTNGGYYGSGIGGGFGYLNPGNSGYIEIKNYSKVTAYGGVGACGIGGGACFYKDGGNIDTLIIKDNSSVYSYGNYVGAGIGGGFGLGGYGGSVNEILISNYADVNAYGGDLAVGIGGGYGGFGGNNGTIIISDYSSVDAYGGLTAGGISGGTSGNLHGIGGDGGFVIIKNRAVVTAIGGKDGSGIGGGAGDLGGNGGTINLLDNCIVTTNNFTGFYSLSENIAELNICGGELRTPNLYLSDLNLFNPSFCGGGGFIIVEDPEFTPDLLPNNFLTVKLIYPDGTPYTSPLFLSNITPTSTRILVTPDSSGFLRFYAADGTYYFATPPIPIVYTTDTFIAPHPFGEVIILVVPVKHITRGINLFKN